MYMAPILEFGRLIIPFIHFYDTMHFILTDTFLEEEVKKTPHNSLRNSQ